jgi:hypothetical protein
VKDRPAETAAALALLPTAYAALVDVSLPSILAGILAVAIAFIPWGISIWRDGLREPDDPGDHDAEGGPPAVDDDVELMHETQGSV